MEHKYDSEMDAHYEFQNSRKKFPWGCIFIPILVFLAIGFFVLVLYFYG